MAYSFSAPATGTIKGNIGVTEEGYIAVTADDDTVAGNKVYTLAGIATDATVAQADALFNAIIGDIAGGVYDSTTFVKTVTYNVVNVGE